MRTILIILAILFYSSLYSINNCDHINQLQIELIEYISDSISFNIKNTTSDTLWFSVFLQIKNFKAEVITSNYDIFSGPGEFFGTLLIRINPYEILRFKKVFMNSQYTDIELIKNNTQDVVCKNEEYRLMIKVVKINKVKKMVRFYSRWLSNE